MKKLFIILCAVMGFSSVVLHAEFTEDDRQQVREIAQQSLSELFQGTEASLADHTLRYTTIMSVLREFNNVAQALGDKALVHAAEKNVEEQYRKLLSQRAQKVVDSEVNRENNVSNNEPIMRILPFVDVESSEVTKSESDDNASRKKKRSRKQKDEKSRAAGQERKAIRERQHLVRSSRETLEDETRQHAFVDNAELQRIGAEIPEHFAG